MTEDLTVLIIGSGAREHAISSAYECSPQVKRIIVAPGSGFMAYRRKKEVISHDCSLKDPSSILEIAKRCKPDLVDVAQDDALAAGTVDLLTREGFAVFGPTKAAARIEWDKKWSREFMQRHNIPVPECKYFESEEPARGYVRQLYAEDHQRTLYIKATGLCAGKGAMKATTIDEAIRNIEMMKTLGDAGSVFLVEEGLTGEEFSYYVISDGAKYRVFKSAQDYKTVFDNDEGLQTGGMGAVSPTRITKDRELDIENALIAPAIKGMNAEGIPFIGILYLGGIMVGKNPVNIEYNARWGDPECQVVLPSLDTDYIHLVKSCLEKPSSLSAMTMYQDTKTRVCVVGASKGYPDNYSDVKGKRILGLEDAMNVEGVTIFGAGIAVSDDKFYANGGRLFNVVGEGCCVIEAKERAYHAMSLISVEEDNLHFRTDIGRRDALRDSSL